MADAAVNVRPEAARGNLNIVVVGKLIDQRRNDGLFYSTILGAAEDQFSQPVPFEVRSERSLGEREEVVTVACKVGGYFRRSYETKPDRDGVVRRVKPVVVALDAIER